MRKSFLVLFVIFMGVFSIFGTLNFLPSQVSAVSTSASVWDGTYSESVTDSDFYTNGKTIYIYTAKGLSYFAHQVNKTSGYTQYNGYKINLMTDIDLNYEEWTPIGGSSSSKYFNGTFNGYGHYIYNMSITSEDNANSGFFGMLGSNAKIQNLHLKNVHIYLSNISQTMAVGAIVGKVGSSSTETIYRSSASGIINIQGCTNSYLLIDVGGAVGSVETAQLKGVMSSVSINVSNIDSNIDHVNVGGLMGRSTESVEISECFHNAYIAVDNGNVGGLLGYANSSDVSIDNSFNTNAISIKKNFSPNDVYAGGLVGYADSTNTFKISNSYNAGDIICGTYPSTYYFGGLVGCLRKGGDSTTVADSFNVGNVQNATDNHIAYSNYLYGLDVGTTITESKVYYYLRNATVETAYVIPDFANLVKTKDFYFNENYWTGDWDFTSVWAISPGINDSLPYLVNAYNVGNANNDDEYGNLDGNGTADYPYLIETAADLGWLSFNYEDGAHYSLQNDIDLSGKTWTPIGTENTPFSGVFNGNGKTISGMTCSLHEPYDMVGLFGVTKNAVIKNLIIGDINYISEEDVTECRGSFVGLADSEGNTYLINCYDDNDAGLPSVGKYISGADSNLYVLWGKLNTSSNGVINKDSLDLEYVCNEGYDVVVSGSGGTFYNASKEIYTGEYHLLLSDDFNILTTKSTASNSVIDSGYGQTVLPSSSEYWGEKDVLIKKGSKLTGYEYESGGSVDEESLTEAVALGLKAVWDSSSEASKIDIKLIYNEFELREFNLQKQTYSSGSLWQVDDNGRVYIDFSLKRDAKLFEYETTLTSTPEYRGKLLRDGNFEIEGIYYDSSFSQEVVFSQESDDFVFVNDNLDKEYFVKWKAVEGKTGQVTIEFRKDISATDFSNAFSLEDAIANVFIHGYDERWSSTEATIDCLESTASAVLDYKYAWSESTSDFTCFELNLNEGYVVGENVLFESLTDRDTNFGLLASLGDNKYIENFSGTNGTRFYNLMGNYKISVLLQQEEFSKEISVSSMVNFAIAPYQVYDSVAVWNGSQYLSLESVIGTSLTGNYIGFDFLNKQIMSSSTDFDAVSIDDSYIISNELSLQYISGTQTNYYTITKTFERNANGGDDDVIVLYQTDENREKIDQLVKYNISQNKIFYFTKSNFVFIFSTEDDRLVFDSYSPDVNIDDYFVIEEKKEINNDPAKILMKFIDIAEAKDMSDISVQTTYTQAIFSIDFNYRDANGNLINKPNAPNVEMAPVIADVTKNGDLKIIISGSDYYKFLYNGALDYSEHGNISVSVSHANVSNSVEYTDPSSYIEEFNNNPSGWLSGSVSSYSKGNAYNNLNGNSTISENQTYVITLSYKSSNVTGGLQPGKYNISLIYTDEFYSLDTGIRFLNYDFAQKSFTLNEIESEIFGANSIQYNHGISMTSGQSEILYGDSISISTALGENNAYEFVGWYYQGEFGAEFVTTTEMSQTFNYYEKYEVNNQSNQKLEDYNLKAYAIYQRKRAEVTLSEQVLIPSYNGGDDLQTAWSDLGIKVEIQGNAKISYDYTSLAETNTQLQNILLIKSGNKAEGYYFAGYKLLNSDGNVLQEVLVDLQNEIDVYSSIKTYLEESIDGETLQEFVILPVLKQKTAKVYFHSGSGDDTNEYGDTKNGQIFDVDGNETTDSVFVYETAYFDELWYLDGQLTGALDGQEKTIAPDDLFNNRTGYVYIQAKYWQTGDKVLNGPIFALTTDYFENVEKFTEIHLYHLWEAQQYTLSFNSNTGIFSGSVEERSTTVTYDSPFDWEFVNLCTTQISKTGYMLAGWQLELKDESVEVFNVENKVVTLNPNTPLFDESENYVYANNATLVAVWETIPYSIQINLNGADSISIAGEVGDITSEYIYKIAYNSTFAELIDSEFTTIKLSEIAPSRKAFKFAGFYAISGGTRYKVDDETTFNDDLPFVSLTQEPSMTIYASWEFDKNHLGLELNSYTFTESVYNGQNQTFYLADMFEESNISYNSNFDIIVNDKALSFAIKDSSTTKIELSIVSSTVSTNLTNPMAFDVKNVGRYSLNLKMIVSDTQQTTGAEILNLGQVQTISYQFDLTITKATLEVGSSNIDVFGEDRIYLENARNIMAKYISQEESQTLATYTTFSQMAEYVRTKDSTIDDSATNLDIYNFLITKYYNMICARESEIYLTYKFWAYQDYATYKTENAEESERLLESLQYFDFYDHTKTEMIIDIEEYSYLKVTSAESLSATTEVTAETARIYTYGAVMLPRGFYSLRLYVQDGDVLDNYQVSYDSYLRPYIDVGEIYILPEIIMVENEGNKSSYFEGTGVVKSIDWQTDRELVEHNGIDYFKVAENVYAHAYLYTSDEGNGEVDTEYSFISYDKYLYFSNVYLIMKNGDEFVNASNYFTLAMSEDDIFTILNVQGIYKISIATKYITMVNNIVNIYDLDAIAGVTAENMLNITSITYNIDGVDKTINDLQLVEGLIEADGVFLGEIIANNQNEVEIFINSAVVAFYVNTATTSITDYIKLHKWTSELTYKIDGTMQTDGRLEVKCEDLIFAGEGLAEFNYYAIYTDLVLVNYNLNFPETYLPFASNSSLLKLNSSTIEDLYLPSETGFVLSSLTTRNANNEEIDILKEEDILKLFTGVNGEFVGIHEDKFVPINFSAKWLAEDIEYLQLFEAYNDKVNVTSSISLNDIVMLLNQNTSLFEYSYQWFKDEELVANGETLILKDNGSYDESGEYKLIINLAVLPEFYSCLANEEGKNQQVEILFTLNFFKNKITSIQLPSEDTLQAVYDNKEHINDWMITISYATYNKYLEDYESAEVQKNFYYSKRGEAYFKILVEEQEVETIKNAGIYNIETLFDDKVYDSSAIDNESRKFNFEITPAEVDISSYNFNKSKKFNGVEPTLTTDVYITGPNEILTFVLTREDGENIKESGYEIYLAGTEEENGNNYVIKYEDTILMNKGALTQEGRTTKIGTFMIEKAGVLQIYYDTTVLASNIEVQYDSVGYNVGFTDDAKFNILKGGNIEKQIKVSLKDMSTGLDVTSSEVLAIINPLLSDITLDFRNGEKKHTVINTGIYTYIFTLGTEIGKYFEKVDFAPGYQFSINGKTVDISDFVFEKSFDGTDRIYYDSNGSKIDDVSEFVGIYVEATFATMHAGENIRVSLRLLNSGSENLSNYTLSTNVANGKINKINATMSFALTKTQYTYGEVALGNVASLVSDFDIVDENGASQKTLLTVGYYQLQYSLDTGVSTNSKGYVHVGNYTLKVKSDFQDFNMTIVEPTFEIAVLTKEKEISENFITISVFDPIATYTDELYVSETGDVLTLELQVSGYTLGQTLPIGNYDFVLTQSVFENGSINVTIKNLDNNGLNVVASTDTLYIRIDTVSILEQIYTGQEFTISSDASAKTITLSNGETSTLSTFAKTETDENAVNETLTSLTISFATTAKNVGTYRLTIQATSVNYTSFSFVEDYRLKITEKTIDSTQFVIDKDYDGTTLITLNSINEKVDGDDLSVYARFIDANAGENKEVQLYLSGTSAFNYKLSSETTTGTILKVQAVLELLDTDYVYSEVTNNNEFSHRVTYGGAVLYHGNYTVEFAVTESSYSATGYLQVGDYDVSAVITSANYDISFTTTTITVSAKPIEVELTKSGTVTAYYGSEQAKSNTFTYSYITPLNDIIELNLTREEGSAVGYYKVLSGTTTNENYSISSVEDLSDHGFFRIIKADERYYLLLSEEEEVAISAGGELVELEYDGTDYSAVSIEESEAGKYKLVLSGNGGAVSKKFTLSAYTLDLENNKYIKEDETIINGVTSELKYLNTHIKNVGEYQIYATNTLSSNYEVKLGKEGKAMSFSLKIVEKQLYFRNAVLEKTFDNKDAIFFYEDASEILDGIVDGEILSLSVDFRQNGQLVKYVGYGYDVTASIDGDTVGNYNLNLVALDTEDETIEIKVVGRILKANINIIVNSQEFVYGVINEENISNYLRCSYQTDVDLTGYDTTKISYKLLASTNDNFAQSGALRVGTYGMYLEFVADDFGIEKYIVNGQEQIDLAYAQLYINTAQLEIAQKDKALKDIFTKDYDGNDSVEIFNENGLLFDIAGAIAGDEVTVSTANYANINVGQAIRIDFVLTGQDSQNYTISPWLYGQINPIYLSLAFNYNAGAENVKSNVELNGLQQLSQLSYPFMSNSYLTSNSALSTTNSVKNFPTSLIGKTGSTFTHWTMDFEVASESDQLAYLESLTSALAMEKSYENGVYSIKVDNGDRTVRLLNSLVGEDTENIMGYYYKENDNIAFNFNANWNLNDYDIVIQIADETGKIVSLGQVQIFYDDSVEAFETIKNTFIGPASFGSKIKLVATANEHCSFYGFYQNDNLITSGTDGFELSGKDTLTIPSVTGDVSIVARFKIDRVSYILDLSDYPELSLESTLFQKIDGQNKWIWETDYLTAEGTTFAEIPEVSRVGYELTGWKTNNFTATKENFDTTTFVAFMTDAVENVLTLKPTFDSLVIDVTLDYGFETTKTINVKFEDKYNSAEGWEESPIKEGYAFVKWSDENGNQITGDSIVSNSNAHTLTAEWDVNEYTLTLIAQNSTIASDIDFELNENVYTCSVAYGSEIRFVVTPSVGYEISSDWAEEFVVTINQDGTANVTFVMPATDYEYTLPVIAQENFLTVVGDNLENLKVYDITETESEIIGVLGKYKIDTGRKVKIVVGTKLGYEFLDEVISSVDGLEISSMLDNNILTVEIEGIVSDVDITITAVEKKNKVTLTFDNKDAISYIDVDGIYTPEDLPVLEIKTNQNYVFYIEYQHGYEYLGYQTDEGFVVQAQVQNLGYYRVEISNVSQDGNIIFTSTLKKFTLNVEAMSYNSNKELVAVEGNNVYIKNGTEKVTTITKDFMAQVILVAEVAENYSFVGWTKDGETIINTEMEYNHEIYEDETLFAIFSTWSFDITFATYNRYNIYEEYQDISKVETIHKQISGASYFDAETQQRISKLKLYYGATKEVEIEVPQGYYYVGYGYWQNGNFVYLDYQSNADRRVKISLSSLDLRLNSSNVTIEFIVQAYEINLQFKSMVDFDGEREKDNNVGWLELEKEDQTTVNEYGYLDGTRVHYSKDSFMEGSLQNNRDFEVVAYTGDVFFIKVKVVREGYKFDQIVSPREDIVAKLISETEEYYFYEISGFICGLNDENGEKVLLEVLYKPFKNIINLTFSRDEVRVDAGVFTIVTDSENDRKVWHSGQEYAQATVLAYTDSEFKVSAFVRVGYYIDEQSFEILHDGIVVEESKQIQKLSIEKTGFVYKIDFKVKDYLGEHNIDIKVVAQTYTVVLKEENVEVARIDNVVFGTKLNLASSNADNITILSDRVKFTNGVLTLTTSKENHHYEGFFTHQNGAGVQYIDANGMAVNDWKESGYVFNQKTSEYEKSENAKENLITGKTEISLYLYWSYLKTRISFTFVPAIQTEYTAQDMVTGVDYGNSWFYTASPMYIEVAFNTDVRIVAPEIDGYRFYKFIISQQQLDGTWLSDVEAFSEDIPWSTNELDKIVACNIQLIYFAEVDVTILGGEGSFDIDQNVSDTQARALLKKGYVDTSMPFTIKATPSKGYQFIRWINSDTGDYTMADSMTLQTTKRANLVMRLEGLPVTLDFSAYSTEFGHILSVKAKSMDNSEKTVRLGGVSGEEFLKLVTQAQVKVGDVLTFAVAIDYGFNVQWNRKDITYSSYSSDIYYFTMTVLPESENQVVEIIPTFTDDFMSFYVTRKFSDQHIDPLAIDGNKVDLAGAIYFKGAKADFFTSEHGVDVDIATQTFIRYRLAKITLVNYNRVFDNLQESLTEEGVLQLTDKFFTDNKIVGNVQLVFEYERTIWQADETQYSLQGEGTSKNPYQIKTIEDLALMMQLCNSGKRNELRIDYRKASYVLMTDLDLTNGFWIPIGTKDCPFDGLFNFNDHEITGIFNPLFYEELNYGGLFGVLGPNARIISQNTNLWYVYLIIAIVVLLIALLIYIILRHQKRKKRAEELSTR